MLVVSRLCSNTDATYKQSLCSSDFFCSLPSEVVCIISGRYTRCDFYHMFSSAMTFTFQNFCACVDDMFLVSNESTWQSLERHQEIMVWSSSLLEERFICRLISRFISLMYYQLQLLCTHWVFTSYFVILKNFCMSLFGHFQFWASIHFLGVLCPRYDPVLTGAEI